MKNLYESPSSYLHAQPMTELVWLGLGQVSLYCCCCWHYYCYMYEVPLAQ
jgi:hypothetical protein